MSRCLILSGAAVDSTNVRLDMRVVSGEVAVPRQQKHTDRWTGSFASGSFCDAGAPLLLVTRTLAEAIDHNRNADSCAKILSPASKSLFFCCRITSLIP